MRNLDVVEEEESVIHGTSEVSSGRVMAFKERTCIQIWDRYLLRGYFLEARGFLDFLSAPQMDAGHMTFRR